MGLVSAKDRHTQADWERSTAAVLRKSHRLTDADPDDLVWEKLSRTTLDGITVPPIGSPANTAEAGLRPVRQGDWDVRPLLVVDDAKVSNEKALVDLENGATSLWLDLSDGGDLAATLAGVLLDLAPIALERPTAEESAALADLLAAYDGIPHPLTNLSADPVTAEMFGHRVADDGRSPADTLVETARRAVELGVLGVVVDGTALHDQGASDAQELGWAMAVGVHYLRVLTEAGLAVAEAAGVVEFRLAATAEQFPTLAKLRAARQMWARVLELSGLEGGGAPMHLHAVTSRPMMTKYDPWVNMLRTTVAAFAAGVGGADAVTVLPFDSRLGQPDAFGRRIARNTSSLLMAESHVAKVADPAGGSYAVERLTHDLAGAGWAELQQIEADGGVGSDDARAGAKARVREAAARRDAGIAKRARPITGVSEFPHLAETLPARTGRTQTGVRHYAAPFEELRDEPAEKPVFLATMGTIASHTARATFASNLLAAGGIAVETAGATNGVEALLAAYAGQPVVCLAGADPTYAEWGADAVAKLREAGARWVILAGKAGTIPEGLLDDTCAMGVDALAFLHRTREKLA